MANDFSGDSNCVALYRFEDGALLTDSIGTNTLSNGYNAPVSSATHKEGSYSADFDGSNDWFYCADADLDADFPLKSGDTNKKISICFWVRFDGTAANQWVFHKGETSTDKRSFGAIVDASGEKFRYFIGYNAGVDVEDLDNTSWDPATGVWYHVGLTYQDSDKSWKMRVWDDTAGSVIVNASGTATNNINVETGRFNIGSGTGSTTGTEHNGLIDEFVVFNDILSTNEIDEIRAGTYEITAGVEVNCSTDALTISAFAADVHNIISVNCGFDALTFTENQANINAEINVQANADSLTISTFAASIQLKITINAGTDALTLTENQAFVEYPTNVQAGAASLSLTTYHATILENINILADVHNLVLQTKEASVANIISVPASCDSLVLQTFEADVDIDVNVQAALVSLALNPYAANINAETNILAEYDFLRLRTFHAMVTAPQSIFHYGDWRDYKGDRTWPNNFKEQPDKWGYLNNPRWQASPQAPVSYTGDEANEPQVWSLPGQGYSSGDSKKHIPCGHWHKVKTSEEEEIPPKIYICDETRLKTIIYDLEHYLFNSEFTSLGRAFSIYEDEVYTLGYDSNIKVYSLQGVFISEFGSNGSGDGQWNNGQDVYVYDGKVYITDTGNYRIVIFDTDGNYISSFNTWHLLSGQWGKSIGVDVYGDTIYGFVGFRVVKYNLAGVYQTHFSSYGTGITQMINGIRGQVYDGQLYVLDSHSSNLRISVWSLGGVHQSNISVADGGVPRGLYIYDDKIFVVFDIGGYVCRVYSMAGVLQEEFGFQGNLPGGFVEPFDVCVYP